MAGHISAPQMCQSRKPAAKNKTSPPQTVAHRHPGPPARAPSESTKAKAARTRSIHQTPVGRASDPESPRQHCRHNRRLRRARRPDPRRRRVVARDRVVSSVSDTISATTRPPRLRPSCASSSAAAAQPATARARGPQGPRPLRARTAPAPQRRRERPSAPLEERCDAVAKDVTELPNRVQERILSIV